MLKKYFLPVVKVLGVMILFGLFNGLFGLITRLLFLNVFHYKNLSIASQISYFAATALTLFIFLKSTNKSLRDIGLDFAPKWYKKLIQGGMEGLVFSIGGILVLVATGSGVIEGFNVTGILPAIATILSGFILHLLFLAAPKELLARGYVFHMLKSKFTATGAILITSVIFSLGYIFNSGANQLFIFNIIIFGVVVNLLVLRDSSIWPAIGFNFGWNFILETVFHSAGNDGRGLMNFSLKGYDTLTGGYTGIKGGLITTIMLLAAVAYILVRSIPARRFLAGLKRMKNAVSVSIISLLTIIYVIINIIVWTPKEIITDNSRPVSIGIFENANNYDMKLKLDISKKTISGTQTVSYINSSRDALKEVYFHIYPNAFNSANGGISIKDIKINGTNSEFKIEGADNTLLYVPITSQLMPGNRVEIYMEYVVNIPERSSGSFADRFAYGNETYNLGNFFPIAAVYENKAWDKHLYDNKGDAFYSETSNFNVEIEAPKSQIIAASGIVESKTTDKGKNIWKISANSVRDFAFVSSSTFMLQEGIVDGTIVKSYASSKLKAGKALEIGQHSIKIFNEKYGKYPYPSLSIVQSDIGGGMEYPNLVMIGSGMYRNTKLVNFNDLIMYGKYNGQFEDVIAHEIGHQWWYGIVGNDEYREAWIDEPLTQYASLTYFKNRYGDKVFNRIYNASTLLTGSALRYSTPNIKHMMRRSLNEFNESEYYSLIYSKGTMIYHDLYNTMGEDKFFTFLQTLFDRYKFKVLKGNELIDTASEIAGKDMKDFFTKWLDTNYMGD